MKLQYFMQIIERILNFFSAAIFCPEPLNVTNGIADTDNRLFGTTITYTCKPGHYYYPALVTPTDRPTPNQTEDYIHCQKEETWTTLNTYSCWRMY